MYQWIPKRVLFEPDALKYELGEKLYKLFLETPGVAVSKTGSHNRVTAIPGKTAAEAYEEAKKTLVVGVRRTLDFQTCKPSAHYQLPLVTSCPGKCEYCYLATTLGRKPYVRVYVNTEEILDKAGQYIKERLPEQTVFEGAATGDPLAIEDYTGSLAAAVEYFGKQSHGRFRFVTKFSNVDSMLNLPHNGHTEWRFSLNSDSIIQKYEPATPRLESRLSGAAKVSAAGYPLGFLIAPIFVYEGWLSEYDTLLRELAKSIDKSQQAVTFELITHRFTAKAKKNILERAPESSLPMEEAERKFKYGQFGYGKYVYQPDVYTEVEEFFRTRIDHYFPQGRIIYLV